MAVAKLLYVCVIADITSGNILQNTHSMGKKRYNLSTEQMGT